jgi:diguanylate cyclase (GGDEF)-like protein/PAS domain S-box-containing protein
MAKAKVEIGRVGEASSPGTTPALMHGLYGWLGAIVFFSSIWAAPCHAEAREVRVGVYANAPKIFLDQHGQVAGILGDLLTEIARQEDWTLKPVQCDWQDCLSALQDGRIDLLPDLAYSTQRAEDFDFHKIPALYSWSTIYRRNGTPVETTLELEGKRVAVLEGSIQEEYLRKLLAGFGVSAQLIPVKSLEEGFGKVAAGEFDAVVANRFFGDLNAPRYKLAASPIMFQPAQLFFGAAHGKNAGLLHAIDRHLQRWLAQQDSPYFKILEKWTGQPAKTIVPPWLLKSLGALAVLLLAALLISAYLRRQVIEKTRHLQAGKEALEMSEAKLRTILDNVEAYIYLKDTRGQYVFANKAVRQLWQAGMEDIVGAGDEKFFDAETVAQIRQNDGRVLRDGETLKTEETNTVALNGKTAVYLSTKLPLHAEDGSIYALCGISIDITERKQTEASFRIAATAFESQESLMITNAERVILRVNQAFTDCTGYTTEDIVGQTPHLLESGRHNEAFYRDMWETIRRTGAWQGEAWDRRKNGTIYPKWLSISAVKNDDGIVTHYVWSHIDITERKAAEEIIEHLAFYDHLTQLPNRQLLLDRLKQALLSSTHNSRQGALLFIDLDNFKNLNDTLGHDFGDLLLKQATQRLQSSIRQGDTVARLGGDEFVVMLVDLSEQPIEAAAQTEAIGEAMLASLSQPYSLDQHTYRCTASIGVTLFGAHPQATEELMKQADIAMYQAKKAGRNTLRFFDRQMQDNISARVALESELQNALEFGQFQLYYQIQVDDTCRPLGAEALIRWTHPERGLVSPVQFIPLAEDTGLILPIGQWVLQTACAQLKAWQQNPLAHALTLAVNVSARQFRQTDFVQQVQAAVRLHDINPSLLKLELTESLLQENIEDTIATMNALNQLGVRFSLDDFGTGYSSLQYLKRLPLDQIKIDQSFVRDISIDASDIAVVRATIAMAGSLGLKVIAEGVETEEQRQLLQESGCFNYQGYLFGRPVPIDQFEALLKPD